MNTFVNFDNENKVQPIGMIPKREGILHSPGEGIGNLEIHFMKASALSRALFLCLCDEDLGLEERDRQALGELAGEVAKHSSALAQAFYDDKLEIVKK